LDGGKREMNNDRRKRIKELVGELDSIFGQLTDFNDNLSEIQQEEQDAYDNLPEGLQETERGETIQDMADRLSDIYDTLDSVLSDLEDASSDLYDLT
jgi:chromosome segregation ATPase